MNNIGYFVSVFKTVDKDKINNSILNFDKSEPKILVGFPERIINPKFGYTAVFKNERGFHKVLI